MHGVSLIIKLSRKEEKTMNILKLTIVFTILCALPSSPAFAMGESPMTEMEVKGVSEVPSDPMAKCHKKVTGSDDNKRYSTFCQTTQEVKMHEKVETFGILMTFKTGGQEKSSYFSFNAAVYSYEDLSSPQATIVLNCTGGLNSEYCESSENLERLHEKGLNLYLAVMPASEDELDVRVVEFKLKRK